MMPRTQEIVASIWSRFLPPPDIKLSEWAEQNIRLPEGQSARPGKYRNWPYFREILDGMVDPTFPMMSLIKSARLGFTKGIAIAIGAIAATKPSPTILLVPTDDDARGYAVDEIEPIFESSPAISQLMRHGRIDGRNTLVRKAFLGGGTLKILAARSPRNLARHDAKNLFCDEVDRMEITKEGDPIALAIMRTFAHGDRKIVLGSTPTEEGLSIIERYYEQSDRRVYEIPCPQCGTRFELTRNNLEWDGEDFNSVRCVCPHNGCLIEERNKLEMVENGIWRPRSPEIVDHRGYRLNTYVSLLKNASWPMLIKEYLIAKKGGPSTLQVYTNTVEAKTWKTSINSLTAEGLAARAEPIGLGIDGETGKNLIPAWVVLLTAGADIQDDRIEITIFGWGLSGAPAALAHYQIDGSTLEDLTWKEFDTFTKTTWPHPNGWKIQLDAVAVDSGGSEGRTQRVYDFCQTRLARRIYAIKGDPGAKPVWRASSSKKVKGGSRLFLIGHDVVKTTVMEALAQEPLDERGDPNPHCLRLSNTLPPDWFDQAAGEARRIKYVGNRTKIVFEPKQRGQRVEALDCCCYAYAVRSAPGVRSINLAERAARLPPKEDSEKKSYGKPIDWAREFDNI